MVNFQHFFLNNFRALQICLLIFLFVIFSNAQSGRRVRTPNPQSTPEVSTPEPEPEKKPKETLKPLYKLKIFNNSKVTGFSQFFFPDKMPVWVTERLRNSPLLDISSGSSVTLNEAKKIAKESTDTFIVLVELDEDQFASPNASRSRTIVGDVYIRYFVLEPETGKRKYTGQVILYSDTLIGNSRVRDARLLCYPQVSGKDLILLYSSIEAAEKIMGDFKIPIPAIRCGAPI